MSDRKTQAHCVCVKTQDSRVLRLRAEGLKESPPTPNPRSHSEINEFAHPANVLECVSCSVFARRRDRAQNNSVAVARVLVIEVRNFTRV